MPDNPVIVMTDSDPAAVGSPVSLSRSLTRSQRRKSRRRKIFFGAIAAVVIVSASGVGAAYAMSRPEPVEDRYVTGEVTTGDVTSTLTYSGTVDTGNQATLAFPQSATVTSVAVMAGDTVTAGQQIAAIDTTGLQQEVNKAQSDLDAANLALYEAENSSSDSTTGSSSPTASSSTPSGSTDSAMPGSNASLSEVISSLKKAQSQATAASDAVTLACGSLLPEGDTEEPTSDPTAPTTTPTEDPTSDPGEEPSSEPTEAPTSAPTEEPSSESTTEIDPEAQAALMGFSTLTATDDELTACVTAVSDLQKAQKELSLASDALAQAALSGSSATCQAPQSSESQTSSSSSPSNSSSEKALSSRDIGGATSVASAEVEVAEAQKALDAAQADLEAATMVAPIDGVVAQLDFAVGDTVSASTTVIIIGEGKATVTLSVPVSQVRLLEAGQEATITQNSQVHSASVTSVSLIPVSSTNYSMIVTTNDDTSATNLLSGASASVTVTTATITDSTVVPISAVTLAESGDSGTVRVLTDDQVIDVTIEVSAVGDTQIAVSEGVEPGDIVILADTEESLPDSTDTSTSQVSRVVSGDTGGGAFGGGAPPGW